MDVAYEESALKKPTGTLPSRVTQSNHFVPQAVPLRSGKVSISAARPNQVSTGRPKPVPTGRPKPVSTGRPKPVPTDKPKVPELVPTGRQNRPFLVPSGRRYSPSVTSGWWKSTARPMPYLNRPTHSYFQTYTPYVPQMYYNHMKYGRENSYTDAEDEGIFDSGCSRSMTDYWKGTIRTPTLDFENVYYVKELQHFNLFSISQICDKKNQFLFTRTDCIVLSKDLSFQRQSVKGELDRVLPLNFFKDGPYLCCLLTKLNKRVKAIRCDNGTKFKNAHIIELCGSKGIKRDYSNARTPQQNGITKRKNRTLIEAARTMLANSKLPTMFWTEAVRTACYVLNRVLVTSPHNKTPYALLTGNIPSVGHFKPFGCHVTILNKCDHLGTQDADSDSECDEQVACKLKGQEQRATTNCKVILRISRLRAQTKLVPPGCIPVPTGSIQIPSGDTTISPGSVPVPTGCPTDSFFDNEPTTRFPSPSDLGNNEPSLGIFSSSSYDDEFGADLNNLASTVEVSPMVTKRINTIHPQSLIIGDHTSAVQTRSKVNKTTTGESAFISYIHDQQRTNHTDFQHCMFACFLSQVEPRSVAQALKDPSWVDAMQDDNATIQDSKLTRQERALIYEESWLQLQDRGIRFFVTQPKGFVDPQTSKKVYKVVKALYGLHQAPRACLHQYQEDAFKPFIDPFAALP
ncbi:putative ribonuclease H-like domain-containing protein [Tanacetum coccineum]